MLMVGQTPYRVSFEQLKSVPLTDLEKRIAKLATKAFTFLSNLFAKIRDFFRDRFGPKEMTEALSVKHEIKQIEQPPVPVKEEKKTPKPNPFVNAMMSLALAGALKDASPETGVLIGKLLSTLTVQTVRWDNETHTGNLGVSLGDGIEGKVSIELPEEAGEATTQKEASVNPFILKALLEAKVDPALIKAVLRNLPASVANVQWHGFSNNLVVVLDLPNAVKLTVDLIIPPEQVQNLFPTLLDTLVPEKAQEILPMIKPLLTQSMTLIWDGKSSDVKLIFTTPQTLDINEVLLKKVGFLQKLVKGLTKNVKVELPQKMEVHVDLRTLEMKFEGATFKVKKGIFSKKVVLDRVAFNPQKKSLTIGIDCLGKHTIPIDLTKSDVDKVSVGIHPSEAT